MRTFFYYSSSDSSDSGYEPRHGESDSEDESMNEPIEDIDTPPVEPPQGDPNDGEDMDGEYEPPEDTGGNEDMDGEYEVPDPNDDDGISYDSQYPTDDDDDKGGDRNLEEEPTPPPPYDLSTLYETDISPTVIISNKVKESDLESSWTGNSGMAVHPGYGLDNPNTYRIDTLEEFDCRINMNSEVYMAAPMYYSTEQPDLPYAVTLAFTIRWANKQPSDFNIAFITKDGNRISQAISQTGDRVSVRIPVNPQAFDAATTIKEYTTSGLKGIEIDVECDYPGVVLRDLEFRTFWRGDRKVKLLFGPQEKNEPVTDSLQWVGNVSALSDDTKRFNFPHQDAIGGTNGTHVMGTDSKYTWTRTPRAEDWPPIALFTGRAFFGLKWDDGSELEYSIGAGQGQKLANYRPKGITNPETVIPQVTEMTFRGTGYQPLQQFAQIHGIVSIETYQPNETAAAQTAYDAQLIANNIAVEAEDAAVNVAEQAEVAAQEATTKAEILKNIALEQGTSIAILAAENARNVQEAAEALAQATAEAALEAAIAVELAAAELAGNQNST